MKRIAFIITLALCSISLASAQTATITQSTAAPTPGVNDIYDLTWNGLNTNNSSTAIWHDQPGQGQTFVTSSNLGGYDLTSVTLGVDGNGGSSGNGPFILSIGTYSSGTFTLLASYTTSSITTDFSTTKDQFITLTLNTPLALLANTSYAFEIAADNDPSNQSNNTAPGLLIASANDTPAGITAFSTAGQQSGATLNQVQMASQSVTVQSFDRQFDVALTANADLVPEPSTYVMMGLGMLALVVISRRKLQI
jgi:PEP-CTERM motif